MKHIPLFFLFFTLNFFLTSSASEKEPLCLDIYYSELPEFATCLVSIQRIENLQAMVHLSDGSQWIVTAENADELQMLFQEWQSGDDIRIKPHLSENTSAYLLKNIHSDLILLADISFNTANSFTIQEIDKNGYLILMQDDNQWAVGYWGSFATTHWRKGDRIIINKSTHVTWEDYLLINIDIQGNAWASLVSWK